MAFICHFHAQGTQRLVRGAVGHLAVRIEVRGVTGTGEPVRVLLDGTTKVRADQTQGGESAFGVEQHSRRVREKRAGIQRIVRGGTQVKFSFGRGVEFKIQIAKQAAKGERAAQVEKSCAGKFENIAAGEVGHGYRYRSTA